jgi:hypothetical protein
VAVAPDGTTTVAWYRWGVAVQSSSRAPGGAWAPRQSIAPGVSDWLASLAIGADGTSVLAYGYDAGDLTYGDYQTGLRTTAQPPGGTWSAAVDLPAPLQIDVVRPVALAVAPDDTATAVWDGGWSSLPPGGMWAAAGLGVGGDDPQVAVAPDGTTIALWQTTEASHTVIQAASRPAGGSWSAPVDLSSPGRNADEPRLAVGTGSGDSLNLARDSTATAVWRTFNGANFVIQSAILQAGGPWTAPVDLSPTQDDARSPDVAAGGNGYATAVWNVLDGSHYVIEAATEVLIEVPPHSPVIMWWGPWNLTAPDRSASDPRVAVSTDGTATVIWSRSDGAHTRVQLARRAEGVPSDWPWTPPANVSPRGHDADQEQVAAASDGTTTAVWRRKDGADWIVEAGVIHAGVVPTIITLPAIGGNRHTGRVLTCHVGFWTDSTHVTIAWYRHATAIRHATKVHYRVTQADLGSVLTCHVTAANAAGTTTAKSLGVKIRH